MSDAWYVAKSGKELGPFSLADLRETLRGRQLKGLYVWRDGFAEWKPAEQIAEFRPSPRPPKPSWPQSTRYATPRATPARTDRPERERVLRPRPEDSRSPSTEISIGHNQQGRFVETGKISPSTRGYEFQDRIVKEILEGLDGFKTVTIKVLRGNVLSLDNFKRRGRDGGLDLQISIETNTRQAAASVLGRVRSLLQRLTGRGDS